MSANPWPTKLRQLRAVHRYTQEYLAEELGIRQNTYSLLESPGAKNPPPHERLEQIAKVYGMTLEEMKAWEPGTVNQSHNHVANAYTTVENQHIVPPEFMQEVMARFDKRMDEADRTNEELLRMNQRLMEIVEKLLGGKK